MICASRTGEVIGAKWPEIDRKAKVWTIPPERMKAGKEHRVPLTERALTLLDEAEKVKTSDYVFPGQQKGKPLSNMAMATLLNDRMKKPDITVHGFRSSFRDWAGETTSFPREVTEAALAHSIGDAVERAYRRGDALEKRRKLMDAWARYINSPKAKDGVVTRFRKVMDSDSDGRG
ncbi:tyrosine-type recombinase/integrase [Bosea vestrisii]|uniref:tyrosine-type recombinase/integrase n=1 Tax=Bosea vestrisii TaxID=151416 RepID=UPI003265A7CD